MRHDRLGRERHRACQTEGHRARFGCALSTGNGTARRWAVVGAIVVVVAGAGVGTWLATEGSGAATGLTTSTTVQTVSTGTISQTVSSSGTIEPANQADLDFAVSGRVTAVNVGVGQAVTAGQALATIDDTSLSASLAVAQATLANDQAQLSADQGNGASSAQLASDSANVASAQSQVDERAGFARRRDARLDHRRHGRRGEPRGRPAGHR